MRYIFGDYLAESRSSEGYDGSAEANEEGCGRPTGHIKREYRPYFSNELKGTRQYEYPTVQRRIYVSVR